MKTLLALPLFVVAAFAADVTGTWTGNATVQTEQGEKRMIPVTLQLKNVAADGLEGTTLAEGEDSPNAISAGKVDGNKIYFEIKGNNDEGPILFRVNLELSGNNLTGTYSREVGGNKTSGAVSFTKKS